MNEEKPNLINITDTPTVTDSNKEQLQYQLSSGKNDTPEHAKKKKKITIILIIVFVLLIVTAIIVKIVLDNRVEMYNGYTEEVGETLKVKEITTRMEIKAISSIEKQNIKDALSEGEYLKIKLSIKNTNKGEEALSTILFSLVDKDKKVLARKHITLDDVRDDIGDMHLNRNETKEGYIYFTKEGIEDLDKDITNDQIITNTKYLKVSVLSYAEESSEGVYNTKYEDYYLTLK